MFRVSIFSRQTPGRTDSLTESTETKKNRKRKIRESRERNEKKGRKTQKVNSDEVKKTWKVFTLYITHIRQNWKAENWPIRRLAVWLVCLS